MTENPVRIEILWINLAVRKKQGFFVIFLYSNYKELISCTFFHYLSCIDEDLFSPLSLNGTSAKRNLPLWELLLCFLSLIISSREARISVDENE